MDANIFPATNCTCQSKQSNNWHQGTFEDNIPTGYEDSLLLFPDVTSQSYGEYSTLPYPASQLPIDPSILQDTKLPGADVDSVAWVQRLDRLEKALEQLQDPTLLRQPSRNWSKLEDLEKTVEGMQLRINHIQDAITSVENWAETMNNVYKEFKGAVCEILRLINCREHLLKVFNKSS